MSHTVFAASTRAELKAAIVAAMLADGWSDDGAPTATILVGAADLEGRKPYIRIWELTSPTGVSLEVGNGRSGDTITRPHTLTIGGGHIPFVEDYYHIFTTDRWVFVERLHNSPTGTILGMLECPYDLVDYTAPLFVCRNYDPVTGIIVATPPELMHSGSQIYVPNDSTSPTGWNQSETLLLSFWASTSVGARTICTTSKHFFRGRGTHGPLYPTTKWWLSENYGDVVGYAKDVYVVGGLNSNSDKVTNFKVQIGNRYYHRVSYDASGDAMLVYASTQYSVAVMLPGELV